MEYQGMYITLVNGNKTGMFYAAWTREPPTEPGWYWAVHNSRVEILEVGYRDGHILSYWESGLSTPPDPFPLDFVDWWLGPLPMPNKPEE